MKKSLILLFVLIISQSFAQKKDLLDIINEKISELKKIESFQNLDIALDFVEDDQLENERSVYNERTPFSSSFFDELPVTVETFYPYSILKVDCNESKLSSMLGEDIFNFSDHPEKLPEFVPQKINFMSGESVNASEVLVLEKDLKKIKQFLPFHNTNQNLFLIKTVQPVESVNFKVITEFGTPKIFTASKVDKVIKTKEGSIKIEEFSKNFITITLDRSLEQNIAINGIHKNGKYLQKKGTFSKFINVKTQDVQKGLELLYIAQQKVTNDEIKTMSDLKKNLKISFDLDDTNTTITIYFAAKIEQVEISIKSADEKIKKVTNYKTSDHYQKKLNEQPFFISQDMASEKYGIAGMDGKWIVQPSFFAISQHNFVVNHFQAAENKGDDLNKNWYRLDLKGKKLSRVAYEPSVYKEKNKGNRIIVKDLKTKKEGLIFADTGELQIPFLYDDLGFREDEFLNAEIINGKQSLQGLITTDNKVIIPLQFRYIKNVKPFLVAYDPGFLPEKIYDKNGNLLSDQFYLISEQFSDDLLLVQKKTPATEKECKKNVDCSLHTKDGKTVYFKNSQQYFIDRNANIKITVDQQRMSDVGEFNNGRAWFTNKESLYGYLDKMGNVVIEPKFDYTVGMNFYGKYAVVEFEDKPWFIDQQGKKIKQLPDDLQMGGPEYIKLYNGERYNYDRDRIKE